MGHSTLGPIGIQATSPRAIERVAEAFCDRLLAQHQAMDDEHQSITLTLGEAEVDVEYLMVSGSVMVQGAVVNDEWVDVDCFAQRVGAAWRRDIERSLGVE